MAFGRWVAAALLFGCVEPLATPEPSPRPEVLVEPRLEAGILPAVRFRVRGAEGRVYPSELSLWTGELTDAQVTKLRRGEVASSLAERELPALTWFDAASTDVVVRPSRFLDAGTLTLLSSELGRLGVFEVWAPDGYETLERRFPPSGEPGAGLSVLCGASAPESSWAFELEPLALPAEIQPGFGRLEGSPCSAVRWSSKSGELAILPPEIEGIGLDPEPYAQVEPVALEDVSCDGLALGLLCARVEDDRLSVTGREVSLLLRVFTPEGAELFLVPSGGQLTLPGFAPDSEHALAGEVITPEGDAVGFDVSFRTLPARVRWVLNEVLANPLGPEPASEWVELVNASAVPASLGGMFLEDSGGRVELPAVTVEPGQYVLLVREDFAVGLSDVAPDPDVVLVRVPALAKNGLSNGGEPLRLVTANGEVSSAFPALPGKHAGVSVARRALTTRELDPDGFGQHAEPGASPGSANEVR